MARYGGSQCQRNFKYLRYLRGVRDTYIRVPSSTTRDSIRHKMEKSGNFLPECKKEREKILRKSNIVGPSFFLSHFSVFHPFFVFSFFPAILDALSLSLSFASLLFSVLLLFFLSCLHPLVDVLSFFSFHLILKLRDATGSHETGTVKGKFRVYLLNFLLIFHLFGLYLSELAG